MKVYIVQPTEGYTKEELAAAKQRAIQAVRDHYAYDGEEITVIDPPEEVPVEVLDFSDYPKKRNREKVRRDIKQMARVIDKLADADLIYLAKGWENLCAYTVFGALAQDYGIDTCCEFEWGEAPDLIMIDPEGRIIDLDRNKIV